MKYSVRLLIVFIITVLAGGVLSAQTDDKWDITKSTAPSTNKLNYTATEGSWMSVDVSPDGNQIVFDLLGHIYLMPVEGGTAEALTEGRSWNMLPRFSPDGNRIAFTSDRSGSDDIWILNLETDSLENLSASAEPVFHPTWAPDGEAVYGSVFNEKAESTGYRYNFYGQKQSITAGGTFQPINQFQEHTEKGFIYYEHLNGQLYGSGASIMKYDMDTGESSTFYQPPGGAFNPTLSPDGKLLAFGHRDNQNTVLMVRNLQTGTERTVATGMDRDHQDYGPYFYGLQPNISWHPDNEHIYFAHEGKIKFVHKSGGELREVPFEAEINREIDETVRFKSPVPEGKQGTRIHRWAYKTEAGILYEALGDLYLHDGNTIRNLTESEGLETSPVYNNSDRSVYYAYWTDANMADIYRLSLRNGRTEKITSHPSMYGGLTVSRDGATLAYFRESGALKTGARIEQVTDFELILRENGRERVLTEVSGTGNFSSRMPLTITFGPEGNHIYYTEFIGDKLSLQRITVEGQDKTLLYSFPHAVQARLSPDMKWIVYREYHQTFITPFEYLGQQQEISAFDSKGFNRRVSVRDGTYMQWTPEGDLSWVRADTLYEADPEALAGVEAEAGITKTNLEIEYEVSEPASVVAFTNARILTMNRDMDVLEQAVILVEGNRIRAVGTDIEIPENAEVFDLEGKTVMPGMIDAHAHYGTLLSQFGLVEQNLSGLQAALAHGVTTMYELYGTAEKDSWVMDMLDAGKITGARLFSTGSPAYGMRFFRPKLYKRIGDYDEALELTTYTKELGATGLKDYVNFTRERRHMLITAARETGMNVLSETAGNSQMNFAQIVDGFTGMEHSMGLSPLYNDVIELFKASDTGVTPTLLVVYNGPSGQAYFNQTEKVWENEKLLNFASRSELLGYKRGGYIWKEDQYAREMSAEMKKLFDAGVLVNMGGHGQMYGLDAHWELELFVQGGFTAMEALQAATINGAKYHGLDEDLGSLEAGKMADIVILNSDPSADIKNLRSIDLVMKNGVLYDGFNLDQIYPDTRKQPRSYFLHNRSE